MSGLASRPADGSQIVFIHMLRGIAPLLVLWAHIPGWWLIDRGLKWPPFEWFKTLLVEPLRLYQNAGHLGVMLFFLISGYIISAVAVRETRAEFVLKRVMRLVPPLVAAVVMMFLATRLGHSLGLGTILGDSAGSVSHYALTAVLANWFVSIPGALSVTWSLVTEVVFYALVVLLFGQLRRAPVLATYAMMGAFAVLLLPVKVSPYLAYLAYFTVYLPLMIQGRIFLLLHSGTATPAQSAAMSAANVLLFLVLYASRFPGQLFLAGQEPAVTYALATATFYAVMVSTPRRCPLVLSFFADISYALYLVHLPVGMLLLSALHRPQLPFTVACAAAIAGSIGAAWLLHIGVERPSQSLARRWAAALRARQSVVAPAQSDGQHIVGRLT